MSEIKEILEERGRVYGDYQEGFMDESDPLVKCVRCS
jgi:hypothetical protein